jgi:hypothetical protein
MRWVWDGGLSYDRAEADFAVAPARRLVPAAQHPLGAMGT